MELISSYFGMSATIVSSRTFLSMFLATFFLSMLLLLQQVDQVEGDYSKYCPFPRKDYHRDGICGTALPNYVKAVCRMYRKRPMIRTGAMFPSSSSSSQSSSSTNRRPSHQGYRHHFDSVESPAALMDIEKAKSMVKSSPNAKRRQRRSSGWQPQSIVCECCYHKCSVQEIREYC